MEKKNEMKREEMKIELPCGKFCAYNCTTCIYWDITDTKPGGYAYCTNFGSYFRADERNGCFRHPKN